MVGLLYIRGVGGFWWDCTVCTKTFHLIYFDAVFSLNWLWYGYDQCKIHYFALMIYFVSYLPLFFISLYVISYFWYQTFHIFILFNLINNNTFRVSHKAGHSDHSLSNVIIILEFVQGIKNRCLYYLSKIVFNHGRFEY